MPDPSPSQSSSSQKQFSRPENMRENLKRSVRPPSSKLKPEQYAQLKANLQTPYRGLRQFIYIGCGASGLIGAFIFLMQLLAGREVGSALPNFALQAGVVSLMIWLYRLEQRNSRKSKP